MLYSDFTVGKVKQAFGIVTIEGKTFFPTIVPVVPSSTLVEVLDETLPLAVALPSEKAKSELLISPILVEAKKADINSGMGQCMAEMVAAQRFNQAVGEPAKPVYGCVSSGLLWRFLKLEGNQMTVDLKDYSLEPLGDLLGKLVWMCGDTGAGVGV